MLPRDSLHSNQSKCEPSSAVPCYDSGRSRRRVFWSVSVRCAYFSLLAETHTLHIMGISRRFSMTLHGSYDRSLKTRRDHNRRQSAPRRGQAVQNHKLPPHIPGPLANDAGNADSVSDVFRKSIKTGAPLSTHMDKMQEEKTEKH